MISPHSTRDSTHHEVFWDKSRDKVKDIDVFVASEKVDEFFSHIVFQELQKGGFIVYGRIMMMDLDELFCGRILLYFCEFFTQKIISEGMREITPNEEESKIKYRIFQGHDVVEDVNNFFVHNTSLGIWRPTTIGLLNPLYKSHEPACAKIYFFFVCHSIHDVTTLAEFLNVPELLIVVFRDNIVVWNLSCGFVVFCMTHFCL